MCEAVGLEVARLKRTTVGPLKLGMLQPGEWRELKPAEVGMLRNAVKSMEETKPKKPAKNKEFKARGTEKAAPKGSFRGKNDGAQQRKGGFGGKTFKTPSKGRNGGFRG